MKTRFPLLLVAMLLLVSCSQEETTNELDNQQITSQETGNLGLRGSKDCPQDYVFPVYDPKIDTDYSITWTIEYNPFLTPEQIYCTRYEYFTQHGLAVKMCVLQPIDPNTECWRLIPNGPSQSTSTTIDDDPRLTINNPTGG